MFRESPLRSFVIAFGIHMGFFAGFMSLKLPDHVTGDPHFITVKLLRLPAQTVRSQPVSIGGALTSPRPKIPVVRPQVKPVITPNIRLNPDNNNRDDAVDLSAGRPVLPAPMHSNPQSQEARGKSSEIITQGLAAMSLDLECLHNKYEGDTDCKNIRRDILADDQLSETDLVWTRRYADSGLPAQFYGLSERQIREKLNVKFAGENGKYIPFTNIGLDGTWWDVIHGVNQSCTWVASLPKGGSGRGYVKKCPTYLPARKKSR